LESSVTALSDGNFIVAWTSRDFGRSQDGSMHGVFGQRFDADANPLGTGTMV
jgi:hypothetical protein